MRHLLFTLLLTLIPVTSVFSQEIPQKQIDFVNSFVGAVSDHQTKKILKGLDKSYRKEQAKFLGSKDQLLDELFAGTTFTGDQDKFVVIKIEDITRIEVAEVDVNESGDYFYVFRVRDGNYDILCTLYLIKNGKKMGFEGARG